MTSPGSPASGSPADDSPTKPGPAFDPHADRRTRYAAGKALRRTTPRESLADFSPAPRDPVAILHEADATRIARLVPIRYERMAASPFAFLRGAAAVMASDLAHAPQAGIPVQACGDAHLMNFGAFDTPEGRVLVRHQRFRRDPSRRRFHARHQAARRERRGRGAGRRLAHEEGKGRGGRDLAGLSHAIFSAWRNCRRWRSGMARSNSIARCRTSPTRRSRRSFARWSPARNRSSTGTTISPVSRPARRWRTGATGGSPTSHRRSTTSIRPRRSGSMSRRPSPPIARR